MQGAKWGGLQLYHFVPYALFTSVPTNFKTLLDIKILVCGDIISDIIGINSFWI